MTSTHNQIITGNRSDFISQLHFLAQEPSKINKVGQVKIDLPTYFNDMLPDMDKAKSLEQHVIRFLREGRHLLQKDDLKLVRQIALKMGLHGENPQSILEHKDLNEVIQGIVKDINQKQQAAAATKTDAKKIHSGTEGVTTGTAVKALGIGLLALLGGAYIARNALAPTPIPSNPVGENSFPDSLPINLKHPLPTAFHPSELIIEQPVSSRLDSHPLKPICFWDRPEQEVQANVIETTVEPIVEKEFVEPVSTPVPQGLGSWVNSLFRSNEPVQTELPAPAVSNEDRDQEGNAEELLGGESEANKENNHTEPLDEPVEIQPQPLIIPEVILLGERATTSKIAISDQIISDNDIVRIEKDSVLEVNVPTIEKENNEDLQLAQKTLKDRNVVLIKNRQCPAYNHTRTSSSPVSPIPTDYTPLGYLVVFGIATKIFLDIKNFIKKMWNRKQDEKPLIAVDITKQVINFSVEQTNSGRTSGSGSEDASPEPDEAGPVQHELGAHAGAASSSSSDAAHDEHVGDEELLDQSIGTGEVTENAGAEGAVHFTLATISEEQVVQPEAAVLGEEHGDQQLEDLVNQQNESRPEVVAAQPASSAVEHEVATAQAEPATKSDDTASQFDQENIPPQTVNRSIDPFTTPQRPNKTAPGTPSSVLRQAVTPFIQRLASFLTPMTTRKEEKKREQSPAKAAVEELSMSDQEQFTKFKAEGAKHYESASKKMEEVLVKLSQISQKRIFVQVPLLNNELSDALAVAKELSQQLNSLQELYNKSLQAAEKHVEEEAVKAAAQLSSIPTAPPMDVPDAPPMDIPNAPPMAPDFNAPTPSAEELAAQAEREHIEKEKERLKTESSERAKTEAFWGKLTRESLKSLGTQERMRSQFELTLEKLKESSYSQNPAIQKSIEMCEEGIRMCSEEIKMIYDARSPIPQKEAMGLISNLTTLELAIIFKGYYENVRKRTVEDMPDDIKMLVDEEDRINAVNEVMLGLINRIGVEDPQDDEMQSTRVRSFIEQVNGIIGMKHQEEDNFDVRQIFDITDKRLAEGWISIIDYQGWRLKYFIDLLKKRLNNEVPNPNYVVRTKLQIESEKQKESSQVSMADQLTTRVRSRRQSVEPTDFTSHASSSSPALASVPENDENKLIGGGQVVNLSDMVPSTPISARGILSPLSPNGRQMRSAPRKNNGKKDAEVDVLSPSQTRNVTPTRSNDNNVKLSPPGTRTDRTFGSIAKPVAGQAFPRHAGASLLNAAHLVNTPAVQRFRQQQQQDKLSPNSSWNDK